MNNAKSLSIFYWVLTIMHLLFEGMLMADMQQALLPAMVTKAFLMPALIWYYYKASGSSLGVVQKLMLVGFIFSWSGDVNLMMPRLETFKPYADLFFLAGLVSFLITHVLYMVVFRKDLANNTSPSLLKSKPWLMLPVLVAYAALLFVLLPAIKANKADMLVPVIVYASVITAMVVFAINRYGKVSNASYYAVLAGALLFMFSDSNIAIDKFHTPYELSRLVIMITYLSSQYLFAWGTRKGA
jgi:uncharacterized membrane protein YhhN